MVETDPRERLVAVGNRLLDLTFELEVVRPVVERMREMDPGSEAARALVDEVGIEVLMNHLLKSVQRDGAVSEYVAIRQTLEALDKPRPEVS